MYSGLIYTSDGTCLPCTHVSTNPSLCSSYAEAQTNCRASCGLCPPPPPPPPSLTLTLSTVAGLTSALANPAVGRIVLAPGTYILNAELSITRSVILEAAAGATVTLQVTLNAQARSRVLIVDPGSSGVVQLIGLGITGGYPDYVRATETLQISHRPNVKFSHVSRMCLQSGGGVRVNSGTVTITSSSIYGNTADIVRAT